MTPYNLSEAAQCWSTERPLTHLTGMSRRGLAVDATQEEWRPVVDWEGYYAVSNLGRVKSVTRQIPTSRGNGYRTMPSVVLKPWIHSFGYGTVRLCGYGKRTTQYIHVLVLTAFRGPCPDGMECCHNDGDPVNNRLDNLRWDTHGENMLDKVRHGTDHLASRTHCKHGHEFTPENLVPERGRRRRCRQCQTDRTARRKAARQAARCGLS